MKDTRHYRCMGGPMHNKHLTLSTEHPYTIAFNLKQWRGRYVGDRGGDAVLFWVSV